MTQSRRNRESGPIERGIARVLVITMLATTPGIGLADDGFDSVDDAVMLTPGRIEDNDDGYTTIYSDVDNGVTDWQGGFDQPAGHVLEFDLAIDGDQAAIAFGKYVVNDRRRSLVERLPT